MSVTPRASASQSDLWLIGQAEKSLDQKNRLVIPSIFRKALGSEELVLTRWFDGALALFPASVWRRMAEAIGRMPLFSPRERSMRLTFFSGALTQYMDNQGRIVLSDDMKEYAGIESQAVLLGDWDKHRYRDFRKRNDVFLDQVYEATLARLAAGQNASIPTMDVSAKTEDMAGVAEGLSDRPRAEDNAR